MINDPDERIAPIWHRFDEPMSDELVRAALASVDVGVLHIQRYEQGGSVVFVDAGHNRNEIIRYTLDRWQFWQGPPMS